jgi:hypothetical protein
LLKKLPVILLLLYSLGAQAFAQNPGRLVSGEMALRAIQKSFPGKIGDVAIIDNDWTIKAGGEIFYWAGGRLLPSAEKDKTDSYSPYFFYTVAAKPTPPDLFPPQYIETLRNRGSSESRLDRKDIHRGILGILYGGLERTEIEALLERVDFLGYKITVHRDIGAALKRIDTEIRKQNGANAFIASIGSIEAYHWRQIAGTQRMSYHSWGLAVDIQPKQLGGKAIYWQWEKGRNRDWMLVPLENRWSPPAAVIETFEKEGFIWGGKWPFYDNMHFEYRPELHEYTRLMAADPTSGGFGRDLHHVYPDTLP